MRYKSAPRFEWSSRPSAQDFELLKLAQQTLPADKAQALFKQVFGLILHTDDIRDFATAYTARAEELYSLDPQDYQEARRLVLETIVQA